MLAELGSRRSGFSAAIKEVARCGVGDTVTDEKNPTAEAPPEAASWQPVDALGCFLVDAADFEAP